MEEREVKSFIEKFFKEKGYYVPTVEFNIGVRPDVVAFKWEGEYEVKAIAVECKKARQIRSLMETVLSQAREYQLAFPQVYLATPKLGDKVLEALEGTLRSLRIGLLSVEDDGKVERVIEPKISPRLTYGDFLFKVRQRAVAILTYKEIATEGKPFDLNIQKPSEVHCYMKKEAANFLLSNWPDADYYFGICIEQKENVKQTLGKISGEVLHKLISDLPEGYLIELDYVDTYRPREVSWPILRTRTSELSRKDVEWLLGYCRRNNWKTRLIIYKKVWGKHEVLSKSEHEGRVRTVKNELSNLRRVLKTD